MPATRVLTAHVPTELAEKVDEWAARNDRPRGWVVKQALTHWIADEEMRHQMTLAGLADVDAGRTVPHSEVMAWIDSLPGRTRRASLIPPRCRSNGATKPLAIFVGSTTFSGSSVSGRQSA